jgi:endonuclease G
MMTIDSTTWRMARRALERAVALHLDDPNVTHIDLGYRTLSSENHRVDPELTVRVHLRQKLDGDAFKAFAIRNPQRVIDADRLGFAVDIPQATYRLHLWTPGLPERERAKFHPELRGGISISNALSYGYGTLGGKVRDLQSGEPMILSNWHVLGGSLFVKPGMPICQPGRGDGGSMAQAVAEYTRNAMDVNLDAAVARLNTRRPFFNEQMEVGLVAGMVDPVLGMRVIKSGRRTGVTTGVITGVYGYSFQRYFGFSRIIRDIVHIAPEQPGQEISAPGDSGSWWLERSMLRAVALHFAGSNDPEFGMALSMPKVLEALNVDILTP